jgi:hypothetical protein
MTTRTADLVLLIALIVTTLGMALITFGVVASTLFFPGVYLLAIGLLGVGAGGLFRWLGPRPS